MAPSTITRHTIAIQQVEQILLGAHHRGVPVEPLLRRAGIPPSLLDSPLSRVTQAQYAQLIIVLSRSMRDELWGLCERPLPLGSFALGCRLLVDCATLGEALRTGVRYFRLLAGDFVPRLQQQHGLAQLSLMARRPRGLALAFAERTFVFFAYGLACWLVARRIPLLGVDYPATDLHPHTDAVLLFQAPVRDGQPCTGWRFDARWLDLPVVQSRQSLAELLRVAPAELLVKYRDHSNLTERIRRILRRRLHEELPTLEEIGQQLAMTPQTLRRRLHDEGQGFRSIRDDLRRDAAIEYLSRPDLTLPAIATLLGFSEASTFHRAFKHWTGVAPGEYRHTHRRKA